MERHISPRLGLAALLAIGIAGCATNGPPTASGRRVTYTCERGPAVTVIYAGHVARVESGTGQTYVLERKESASGFWYESPTHRLRGKGNQISFSRAWTSTVSCRT